MLRRESMRNLLFALFAVVLLVVGLGLWWSQGPPQLPPVATPDEAAVPTSTVPGEVVAAPRSAVVEPSQPEPTAVRTPADLADHVTAWLQVVDADTGAPVPAAAAYRYSSTDEAAIGYSDASGIVPLPLRQAGQLIVVRAGYLLRLAPVQPGSSPEVPQIVQLEPDRYCSRCLFRFRLPDGSKPGEVKVRFRPQRGDDKDQPMPAAVRTGNESVQRAWREQRSLAAVRAVPELHVQLGFVNAAFVHQLAADDEVAFVESGLFELEAVTAEGFAARALFDTADVARDPLTVRMQRGGLIRGRVRSADGQPIQGARVAIVGSDPLRLVAQSSADGTFAIGPLAPGSYGLDVRHRDFAVGRAGPASPGDAKVTVELAALPRTALRGRVRAAGAGTPIAGARATVIDAVGQPIAVESDEEGFFGLPASGTEAIRLNIAADGYLPHAEFVEPGGPSIDVELWPRNADARRQLGLTGFVNGMVVDAQGVGVAGVGIRYQPAQPLQDWMPGRRIISGGMMSLPRMATSAHDGTFRLETAAAGPGTISAVGAAPGLPGLQVEVVLGRSVDNVRLTARRPQ